MRATRSVPYGVLAACLAAMALAGFATSTVAATPEPEASITAQVTPLGDNWNANQLGQIHLEQIAALHVVSRTVRAGYDKTNEVFVDLKTATLRQFNSQGFQLQDLATDCLASYPTDPDTVSSSANGDPNLAPVPPPVVEWTASIPVPKGFKAPSAKSSQLAVPAASNYQVGDIPATLAATMFSTVGRAPVDGLKFFKWMADNGYVQIGPTRMVYYGKRQGGAVNAAEMLNASPELINLEETKIVVPVKKRDRGIALKPASQTVQPPGEHQ